jgi:hypothetical protein
MTLLLSLSTALLAWLSSWHPGSFPWEGALLFLAVAAADRAAASLRAFFQPRDSRRIAGLLLLTGTALLAFAAVLTLFLALREGWPLLVLGGASLALSFVYSSRPHVASAPWGELLFGLVPGALVWAATAFVFDPSRWSLEFWWRTAAMSVPTALFLASLATVARSCDRERAGHGILLLPLAAYVGLGVLAALRLLPWTFFLVVVAGPACSAPLWRSMVHRGFAAGTGALTTASRAFLVYVLLCAAAAVTGSVLS